MSDGSRLYEIAWNNFNATTDLGIHIHPYSNITNISAVHEMKVEPLFTGNLDSWLENFGLDILQTDISRQDAILVDIIIQVIYSKVARKSKEKKSNVFHHYVTEHYVSLLR